MFLACFPSLPHKSSRSYLHNILVSFAFTFDTFPLGLPVPFVTSSMAAISRTSLPAYSGRSLVAPITVILVLTGRVNTYNAAVAVGLSLNSVAVCGRCRRGRRVISDQGDG